MVGFGYGFTGAAGQPWCDILAEEVGTELAAEWLNGHFEFAEFGVILPMRKRGIGTRQYEALFDGLPSDRTILTVREENASTRRFYGCWLQRLLCPSSPKSCPRRWAPTH